MKFRHIFIVCIALIQMKAGLCQAHKSTLFIGNSHIFYSDMPTHFFRLCRSVGDTLIVGQRAPGGWGLSTHLESSETMRRIKERNWDYIILQESRGGLLSANFDQVITSASSLKDSIKRNSICTRILWDMIHPATLDMRLAENSFLIADSLGFEIAPVWEACFDLPLNGWVNLLLDGNHQNVKGAYLTACVFYSTIFHRSCEGRNTYFPEGISSIEARQFQQVAWNIVSDFGKWNIDSVDVSAQFDVSILPEHKISISNFSENATSFIWTFGDGGISYEFSPTHQYAKGGQYVISLTAKSGCKWDLKGQSISLSATARNFPDTAFNNVKVSYNPNTNRLRILNAPACHLVLYSVDGKIITTRKPIEDQTEIGIPGNLPGIILLTLQKGNAIKTFKIINL